MVLCAFDALRKRASRILRRQGWCWGTVRVLVPPSRSRGDALRRAWLSEVRLMSLEHEIRLELSQPGSGRRGWEAVCRCGWIGHLRWADTTARAEGMAHIEDAKSWALCEACETRHGNWYSTNGDNLCLACWLKLPREDGTVELRSPDRLVTLPDKRDAS